MEKKSSDSCHSRRRRRHAHQSRKERVLHTRVSEQLSEDIRKFAEDLRVPASNLVRNVLEEVFTMVDGVSVDVGDLFDDLIDEAEGVRERVRRQTASSRRRRGRSGRRHRRAHVDDDADIEGELKQDEASEEPQASSVRESGSPDDPDEAQSAESRPRAAELFPDVLGWQPLVLNRDFECGRCARALAPGESAFLGLGESGLTQIALCGRCAGRR